MFDRELIKKRVNKIVYREIRETESRYQRALLILFNIIDDSVKNGERGNQPTPELDKHFIGQELWDEIYYPYIEDIKQILVK